MGQEWKRGMGTTNRKFLIGCTMLLCIIAVRPGLYICVCVSVCIPVLFVNYGIKAILVLIPPVLKYSDPLIIRPLIIQIFDYLNYGGDYSIRVFCLKCVFY